ncbi:MAG TPA: SRPBCC family protein [Solirubrobacteraceae bacterium]
MKSEVGIHITAPYEVVFELAAEVERWPQRLAHYRYVRAIGSDGERRFAMGARRGRIPVAWEAIQRPLRDVRRIEFHHTGGVTRGMDVAWTFSDLPDGVLDVRIAHALELRWPVIGAVAEAFIATQFIEPIARRTLRRIRALAEARA